MPGTNINRSPTTGSQMFLQTLVDVKPSQSISRKPSFGLIRPDITSDSKTSIQRKKSVTWDPLLDEKHGPHDTSTISSHARREPYIRGLSSYCDGAAGQSQHRIDIAQALDAIQFEYWKIRPRFIDFIDPRSALLEGYSHEREYRKLSELLMRNVLEQVHSLNIDSRDQANRRTRKEIAIVTNELLQKIDTFIQDHRNTTVASSCQSVPSHEDANARTQPEDSKFYQTPADREPMAASGTKAESSPDPCLGRMKLTLTQQELTDGCRKPLYIHQEPFDAPRYMDSRTLGNFYVNIPSASMHGDHVRARLMNPEKTFEDYEAYFDVALVLDEAFRAPETPHERRRRSSNRPPQDLVPLGKTRHRRSDHNQNSRARCYPEDSRRRDDPGRGSWEGRGPSYVNRNEADSDISLDEQNKHNKLRKRSKAARWEDHVEGARQNVTDLKRHECDCLECNSQRSHGHEPDARRSRNGRHSRSNDERA